MLGLMLEPNFCQNRSLLALPVSFAPVFVFLLTARLSGFSGKRGVICRSI